MHSKKSEHHAHGHHGHLGPIRITLIIFSLIGLFFLFCWFCDQVLVPSLGENLSHQAKTYAARGSHNSFLDGIWYSIEGLVKSIILLIGGMFAGIYELIVHPTPGDFTAYLVYLWAALFLIPGLAGMVFLPAYMMEGMGSGGMGGGASHSGGGKSSGGH